MLLCVSWLMKDFIYYGLQLITPFLFGTDDYQLTHKVQQGLCVPAQSAVGGAAGLSGLIPHGSWRAAWVQTASFTSRASYSDSPGPVSSVQCLCVSQLGSVLIAQRVGRIWLMLIGYSVSSCQGLQRHCDACVQAVTASLALFTLTYALDQPVAVPIVFAVLSRASICVSCLMVALSAGVLALCICFEAYESFS